MQDGYEKRTIIREFSAYKKGSHLRLPFSVSIHFSTRVRTHIYVGQRLQFHIPDSKRLFSRSVTAFYEISTCDLYVVSAFTNHLNPDDYLRLSFGLKFDIF